MDWLWIPAVSLIGLLILLLCWLFFQDYTCCPCRRRRPPELYLPTHTDSPSVVRDIPCPPRQAPSRRARPPVPAKPPSLVRQYALSPTGSPNLHLKHGNFPISRVVRWENGVPTLDLHRMTVVEATDVTSRFIRQSHGRYRKVRVVTGRGNHSELGVPTVRPAIAMCLRDAGCGFKEINRGGCFEVVL